MPTDGAMVTFGTTELGMVVWFIDNDGARVALAPKLGIVVPLIAIEGVIVLFPRSIVGVMVSLTMVGAMVPLSVGADVEKPTGVGCSVSFPMRVGAMVSFEAIDVGASVALAVFTDGERVPLGTPAIEGAVVVLVTSEGARVALTCVSDGARV